MTEQTKRAIPELSLDTQVIERLLRAMSSGDVMTYRSLSAAVGRDVQKEARGNLTSARKRLLRTDRALFGTVVDVGLKRLDDVGKVGAGRTHLKRARGQATRALAATSAVEHYEQLPPALKKDHFIVMATAGALRVWTSSATGRKLEASVTNLKPQLSLRESLELMKGAI